MICVCYILGMCPLILWCWCVYILLSLPRLQLNQTSNPRTYYQNVKYTRYAQYKLQVKKVTWKKAATIAKHSDLVFLIGCIPEVHDTNNTYTNPSWALLFFRIYQQPCYILSVNFYINHHGNIKIMIR